MSDLDDLLGPDPTAANDSGQSPAGGKLRQQLEAVLEQNKQLQQQLAKVQEGERTRSLDALFAKHSVPQLARDLFPKDSEPTDEAVTALVEKYGELWGATAQPATTPPADQAATAAAQRFAAQASPAPVAPLSEDEYRAKFAEAQTKDEFLKMLAELSAAAE